MKLLDTSFLIDLQREMRSNTIGPARSYLAQHANGQFVVSMISVTEFLEGFEDSANGEALLRPFRWLSVNVEVARQAARIRRKLRMEGRLIGDFDILIAATALVGGFTLVSRDAGFFSRIDGIELETY